MQSILSIRRALRDFVPGAFLDLPSSETAQSGNYPTTTIWQPAATQARLAPEQIDQTTGHGSDSRNFEFAPEAEIDIEQALGSGLGQHIDRAAMLKSVDGLAWYVSFHARGPQWGIYIPISSVVGMAGRVFGSLEMNLAARMRLSAHAMHQHELFHFAVDHMTALHELTQVRPCWLPGRSLLSTAGYYELEEKLANAYMLRRINAVNKKAIGKGRAEALRQFVALQPAGYRDAVNGARGPVFRRECRDMCIEYFERANGGPVPEELFRVLAPELLALDRLDWRHCPVHLVQDEKRFSLPQILGSLFANVPWIHEPESFLAQLRSCDR